HLLPVAGPLRVLDHELDALALRLTLALAPVGVAGPQLHVEPSPRRASLIIVELDLAVDAAVAVDVPAIDLSRLGDGEARVMGYQQRVALVVDQRLSIDLEPENLVLDVGGRESLLDGVAQRDRFAACGTEDLALSARCQCLVDHARVGEGLPESMAPR